MEVEKAVEYYLKKIDKTRLEMFGGYAAIVEYKKAPGYVIVAAVEDAGPEPSLAIFTTEEFVEYVSEIAKEWEVEYAD